MKTAGRHRAEKKKNNGKDWKAKANLLGLSDFRSFPPGRDI